MEKEKSLIEQKNRNGIGRVFNNVVEFIKSRVSKNYVLSESSPDFLWHNRNLVLKTIKDDFTKLKLVPDDMLLAELQQNLIPTNGIIDTAFKEGYYLGNTSPAILLGSEAKQAILQYIKMIKYDKNDDIFKKANSNSQLRLSSILENIDEKLLLDDDFKKQLLDLAVEKGYKISVSSKVYLKQNSILAENYYKDLLEENPNKLMDENILSPELIQNKEFLHNYIKMLSDNGIDEKTIIDSLIMDPKCLNVLKNDIGLFQQVFEEMEPSDLAGFFDKIFTEEELEAVFKNQDKLNGKMFRLSQLYAKDKMILKELNGKLLGEKYSNIPNYKMQIIARQPKFEDQILQLNDYEYAIYSKTTQLVSQKTNRWNRFEESIVNNLSNGYYSELVADLYEQAKQGNKITEKDMEALTFLLSNGSNIFNITSKKELEHLEEIKELVCDTVLTNPSLDDQELTAPLGKQLESFKKLPELDRMKLALLEKYYNINLREANDIIENFSTDINNINPKDETQASIVEQIKAIKNIFECDDINVLRQVGDLDILVETDLSSSIYLIEQTKEMFAQEYKENLYMPKEDDRIESVTYNGKSIEVFDANIDFSMIVKTVAPAEGSNKELWDDITKQSEHKARRDLRFYTCCSYMTDENILKSTNNVILGFAQGTKEYSIDSIFPRDIHSPYMGGDPVYLGLKGSFMLPDTLEANTDTEYNELILNTLGIDEQGNMTKMQPDYIIYIKNQSDTKELDQDPIWEASKKAASEFGIPIVIVDREKVKENEKQKISSAFTALDEQKWHDTSLIARAIQQIEHFKSRYGIEEIPENAARYADSESLENMKRYVRVQKRREMKETSIPDLSLADSTQETSVEKKQDILQRQARLKEENAIGGEER